MMIHDQAASNPQVITGITLATAAAGIRYRDRDDLLLIAISPGSTTVAVFTQNLFAAAPIKVAQAHRQLQSPRALLINAGNANAATGRAGEARCRETCAIAAAALEIEPEAVWPFSTGVIGEQLPIAPFERTVPVMATQLSANQWDAAAAAIMTTDTKPKQIQRQLMVGDQSIRLNGIAKGSGMIQPNMATMLAFFATDLAIDEATLSSLCSGAVEDSFNAISIDSDTSTNDACVLIATGQSKLSYADLSELAQQQFREMLREAMQSLAQAIVRDGEGATKFITVSVTQAPSREAARSVAFSIANSPLVKTALFASDPNWGRFAMAIGKAGVVGLSAETVSIRFNGVSVMIEGQLNPDYREADGQRALAAQEITVDIDLGAGIDCATVWTSDLSYDYIKINADYRS